MRKISLAKYTHLVDLNTHVGFYNSINFEILYAKKEIISELANGAIETQDNAFISKLEQCGMIFDESFGVSLKSKIERILPKSVSFLYIVPTVNCNLNCQYCHIQNNHNREMTSSMDFSTLTKGIQIFGNNGGFESKNSEVMFYGGEPLLEKDIVVQAVNLIKEKSSKTKIIIFTNGTLLTDSFVEFIIKNDIYVIVSIDGMKPQHDQTRIFSDGSGSFNKTLAGYRLLKDSGAKVGISLVMGQHNVGSLKDILLYFLEDLEPLDLGMSTLHLFPAGENPCDVGIDFITDEMIDVYKVAREHGFYIEHLFRRIRPFVEKSLRLHDCPSCGSKLLITPWRTIGFCEAFMELHDYFYDIDTFDMSSNKGYEVWRNRSPLLGATDCHNCIAIGICGGGCPYDAFCESGTILGKDSRKCTQSKKLINWLIGDLFSMLNEKGKLTDNFFIPTDDDRKLIYRNVEQFENIPLQGYSKSGEGELN